MGLPGLGPRAEPSTRIRVTVTFLRMDHPPAAAGPALPSDTALVRVTRPSVEFYRYLYATVGAPHAWWLRRTVPDEVLQTLLRDAGIAIHVLYRGGEPAGFFELDSRARPDVNLSYFGLVPHAVGTGLGTAFLRRAVDQAWALAPRSLTVNTCTADHPRAMPAYLRAGFVPIRSVAEVWDVPKRLGLMLPAHLLV
ncbi:MAG: GNAT family N-acetyltransferase [Janthinobacterium lividum]